MTCLDFKFLVVAAILRFHLILQNVHRFFYGSKYKQEMNISSQRQEDKKIHISG